MRSLPFRHFLFRFAIINIKNLASTSTNVDVTCENEVADEQTMWDRGRRKEDGPSSSIQKPFCARLEIYPFGKGKGK